MAARVVEGAEKASVEKLGGSKGVYSLIGKFSFGFGLGQCTLLLQRLKHSLLVQNVKWAAALLVGQVLLVLHEVGVLRVSVPLVTEDHK